MFVYLLLQYLLDAMQALVNASRSKLMKLSSSRRILNKDGRRQQQRQNRSIATTKIN
jgi:hypothetical protein